MKSWINKTKNSTDGEREEWSMHPTLWLFRGSPKGLVSIQLHSGVDGNWHMLDAEWPLRRKRLVQWVVLLQRNHGTADRHQREQKIASCHPKKNPNIFLIRSLPRQVKKTTTEKIWELWESPAEVNGETPSLYQGSTERLGEVAIFKLCE